jgi:Patatin-like phospholipase
MADEVQKTRAADSDKPWSDQHHYVVASEIVAINTRRDTSRLVAKPEPGKMIDVVGLALSGGGIRSSAICLGVLQALNHHDLIKRIDYLSTVSGGGYIGSSLTATMTCAKEFVFGQTPVAGSVAERASEISDTPAVGHIRNYSNYLIPAGARDLLTGIAIVVRGLVANLSLTLPVVLVLAAVTVWSTPLRSCLAVANLFGVDVGAEIPKQCDLHHFWLVDHYGFTAVAALAALLPLVASVISYLVSRSAAGRGPSIFLVYLAGFTVVIGAICDFAHYLPVRHFALTLAAALLGLVLFFAWALKQSFAAPDNLQEFRGHWPTIGATFLVLLALIGFFEFQPFMIAEMFDTADSGVTGSVVGGVAIGWVKSLAAITAPIAGVVTVFRQQFAELLKGNSVSSEFGSMVLAIGAKAAIWIAGAALPLIIWVGYLYLCYWGIGNDAIVQAGKCPPQQSNCSLESPPTAMAAPKTLAGKIQFDSKTSTFLAEIAPGAAPAAPKTEPVTLTSHTPGWLVSLGKIFGDPTKWSQPDLGYIFGLSMAALYASVALLLFFLSLLLTPNANSLHRLYRDRLSKAFLFDPKHFADGQPARVEASLDQGRDFLPLDRMKLSDLFPPAPNQDSAPATGEHTATPGQPAKSDTKRKLDAPYHLINTALNIQGSDYANRRGRNADFFLFSPLHVGSEATNYANTVEFEGVVPALDLATAIAVSGAAASSNMGSSSIKPLTPTLALLNVRLGYWLTNPRYVPASPQNQPKHHSTALYLWSEVTGRLYENADAVYLTDGGHIENLGVYELLRRRCKVIIAVDAEADVPMNFTALMTLQRYARIDLGIRIDLPWTPIRTHTLEWMNCNAGKPPSPAPIASDGPHVAVGVIDYGGGEKGYLVYIKSSLSGDENDYIRDYARRNYSFPHETTGDQFFSEEQFEVYRALGFHMTHGFLSGDHDLAVGDGTAPVMARFTAAGVASIDAVRAAFGLPAATPAPPSDAGGELEGG